MSLPYWSSTSWLLFSLVVITHKYVFMYAYTFLNIDYLVHMTLLACLFSGLVVWHWETNWCVMIWRKPLLLLPVLLNLLEFFFYYFIFVCVGLCPHWLFSSKFGMFFGAFLYSLKLEQLCLWNFMAVASDVSIRHNITAKSLFLWLLKCFLHPSSIIVPEPEVF